MAFASLFFVLRVVGLPLYLAAIGRKDGGMILFDTARAHKKNLPASHFAATSAFEKCSVFTETVKLSQIDHLRAVYCTCCSYQTHALFLPLPPTLLADLGKSPALVVGFPPIIALQWYWFYKIVQMVRSAK